MAPGYLSTGISLILSRLLSVAPRHKFNARSCQGHFERVAQTGPSSNRVMEHARKLTLARLNSHQALKLALKKHCIHPFDCRLVMLRAKRAVNVETARRYEQFAIEGTDSSTVLGWRKAARLSPKASSSASVSSMSSVSGRLSNASSRLGALWSMPEEVLFRASRASFLSFAASGKALH